MMSGILRVGMSQVDITPPAPVTLCGQFHTRISRYVESPLLANVFAAESDGEQLIICACDVVAITADACRQARELIQAKNTGIDVSKIIFCATHTHTGPNFFKAVNTLHVAAKYLPEGIRFIDCEEIPAEVWLAEQCGDYIAGRLCDAVCNAWEKRGAAFFSRSFGRAAVGHCRRVVYDDDSAKMYGTTDTANFRELEGGNDSGIELVYFFDAGKRPIGALVNVACPSQVVEGECFVSSDFWGKARDFVKRDLGDNFVVVGLCSAAGDQSPRDMVRRSRNHKRRTDPDMYSLPGAIELGRRVADVVLANLADAGNSLTGEALIRHQAFDLDFPLRTVTISEYEQAKNQFEAYVAKSGKSVFTTADMSALHIFGGIMDRYHVQQQTQFYTAEIHIARLGDVAIATNPFELFLDYGNQIRARSEATQTVLIQLACDSGGYLPTEKAERGSHYSAYVSSGETGHAGGELLVRKSLDVIQQLWR